MRCKSWSWIFIPFLLAALRATGLSQVATTQIADTIYHADGTTATGTVLISCPAFITPYGDQLPADPVSSLQAATKHYVDTAVAQQSGTGLTGQTPNYLPLATTSTTSTTSSHFYESNGTSGVTNPFAMGASAPNCNIPTGETFTRYKCFGVDSYDDGSSNALPGGSRNLNSFVLTHYAWGPAGGGGGEN